MAGPVLPEIPDTVPEEMMVMRKLAAGIMVACSLSGGCRYLLPVVAEPIRIENADDMAPERLGFAKGKTTFDEAHAAMKSRRLTGITKTIYTDTRSKGPSLVLHALSADYQTRVHIFEDGLFADTVRLPSGGVLPYGGALSISSAGGKVFLLALYRDPLEMTDHKAMAQAPRIDIFERTDGRFVFRSRFSLGTIASENGGITRPIFVGHDLDEGIMLLARDSDGVIWDGGYFLRLEGGLLKTAHVPLEDASRCSCVQKYMYGEDIESLWRE